MIRKNSGWSPKPKKQHRCRKPHYLSIRLHGGLAAGIDLRTSRIWTCGDCNKSYRAYWTSLEDYTWVEVKDTGK